MGWRSSEIEVYHTIDLSDYDDEIMEYIEPDNISDALDLMERWKYSEADILAHMIEETDSIVFLEQLSSVLTVETALAMVKDVYELGNGIRTRNETAKDNQIADLRLKVQELEKANDNTTV